MNNEEKVMNYKRSQGKYIREKYRVMKDETLTQQEKEAIIAQCDLRIQSYNEKIHKIWRTESIRKLREEKKGRFK